jgi:hypothetical protein
MATFVQHPAVTSGKLPYFIMIVPHIRSNDGGPPNAIRTMMKNWPLERKPHIVTNSGFGSFALLTEIAQWGGTATLLIANKCEKLDTFLSYNLPLNHWRACINSQGIIFSAQCKTVELASGATAIGKKFVISNSFTAQGYHLNLVNVSVSASGTYNKK